MTSFSVFPVLYLVFPESPVYYVSSSNTLITRALLCYSNHRFLSPFSTAFQILFYSGGRCHPLAQGPGPHPGVARAVLGLKNNPDGAGFQPCGTLGVSHQGRPSELAPNVFFPISLLHSVAHGLVTNPAHSLPTTKLPD